MHPPKKKSHASFHSISVTKRDEGTGVLSVVEIWGREYGNHGPAHHRALLYNNIVSCSNGGCCQVAGRRHADPPPGWDGASPGHLYAAWSFPAPALTVRPHVLALTVAAHRLVHAAAYYRMRFESSVMGQHMVRGCVAPLKRDLHE